MRQRDLPAEPVLFPALHLRRRGLLRKRANVRQPSSHMRERDGLRPLCPAGTIFLLRVSGMKNPNCPTQGARRG
jgi:hypothetical protein